MMVRPVQSVSLLIASLCLSCGCSRDSQSESSAPSAAQPAAAETLNDDAPLSAASLSFAVPDPPADGFVGSQACVECHQEVHSLYQAHPMASSMAAATDTAGRDLLSDSHFSPFDEISYAVTSSEKDGMVHTERRTAVDQTLYEHAVPVDYRVGSGVHGFSYLLQSDSLIFQSPLSWYRAKACWDMSPGYDLPTNPGFERLVTHNCIACHAGRARPQADSRLRFEQDAFAELQVGCERCHGPGESHIAFQKANAAGQDPILKFAELPVEQKNAVCFQCHLQGARRVARYGRSEFDFRPGMKMSDVWTTFLKDQQTTEDSAVSHAEQMFQSRCYSSGQLTCVSCHDPHSRPSDEDSMEWYRGRCLQCHTDADDSSGDLTSCAVTRTKRKETQPDDSCVACHMPPASLEAVPHTAHTDHRVRRRPDAPAFRMLAELLHEQDSATTPSQLQRARGIYLAEQAYGADDRIKAAEALRLLTPVLEKIPGDPLACEAAGRAASTLGLVDQAIAFWDQALQQRPRDILLLLMKGSEQHNARQFAEAARTYRQLIAADPHRAMYHGRLSHVLGMLGRMDESIAASLEALKRNPGLPQAHSWLGMLYERQGDQEQSKFHRQQATQLEESFRASMESAQQAAGDSQ